MSRFALQYGVAPSFEHSNLLKGLGSLKCLVDVGANVGQFSLLFRMINPSAQIHAFEPLSHAAKKFEVILGNQNNVTLYRHALGRISETVKINVTARADSSSILYPAAQSDFFSGTHCVSQEKILVRPLQEVLSIQDVTKPSLLKIDVQGYELEVLRGSEGILMAFDWIYCEASFIELYSGQPLAHEVISWLAERGFYLTSVNCSEPAVDKGRTIQADFLFRRIDFN
jgi:FkbM family methyltransferase